MLLVWKMPVTRPARDIDLLGRVSNDLASVRKVMATICQVSTEADGLFLDSETVTTQRITEDADYEGVHATFRATLGNTHLPMQIAIGFSDVITPELAPVPTGLHHRPRRFSSQTASEPFDPIALNPLSSDNVASLVVHAGHAILLVNVYADVVHCRCSFQL